MINYLKGLKETVEKYPDRVAVVDKDGARSTSYRQLFELAAKINRWMRNHDIVAETVVAIYFPKSLEAVATRIGIIMAGAAWVTLEDMMGEKRIEFVKKDCGCKLVFDSALWEEAMQLEPCYDFADSDEHDLACIFYTSGSTGEPKGAANEYGVYDYVMTGTYAVLGRYAFPEGRNGTPTPFHFAHILPDSFVGSLIMSIGVTDEQSTLHIISPQLSRDLKGLIKYFIEHGIDVTFMPPTFLNLAQTVQGLSLRAALTGGEKISNIYSDKFDVVIIYSSTEMGYPACTFTVDHPYDRTPAGYPTGDTDFHIIDENGTECDEGELIVYLPFFRGYHNLPKENEKAHIMFNGKKYFRIMDIARRDKKGCYTILGRMDDMVKINGNRVDPSEIEKAMKEAFGLEFCVVKAIKQADHDVLCAWYTEDKVPEAGVAAKILSEHLPYYMIPSNYVHIDNIPTNANGKVDKKSLPVPDLAAMMDYQVSPESRSEKLLCDIMEKVLKTGRAIGVNEDFFNLGGDSIHAMQIIVEDVLPGLTMPMIYEGRTVRNICRLYAEWIKAGENINSRDSLQEPVPINSAQEYLLEYDRKYPGTVMLNIPVSFHLRQDMDLQKFADVIRTVIRAHPALLSTVEPSPEGGYWQRYDESFDKEIPVERVTDEELKEICRNFVRPFTLDGSKMMRCRILETDKEKVCLFDVSHLICDGGSLTQFFGDIVHALKGEEIKEDYCFNILRKEVERKTDNSWQKDMEYFRGRFDREGFATLPKPDHVTALNKSAYLFQAFEFEREAASKVRDTYQIGKNGLYLLASAMAIAEYNDEKDVLISWTWDGRGDVYTKSSVGVFFRDIPAAFHIEKGADVQKLLKETRAQIAEGVAHGHASYFMETGSYRDNDLLCMLYQGELYQYIPNEFIVSAEMMDRGDLACNNALNVEILESADDFGVMLSYNAAMYDEDSMKRFAQILCDKCHEIIAAVEDS